MKQNFFSYPPNIAKNGLSGFSSALEKYCNSFFNKQPDALNPNLTPTIELCALCAVPKASFINTSPNLVNDS